MRRPGRRLASGCRGCRELPSAPKAARRHRAGAAAAGEVHHQRPPVRQHVQQAGHQLHGLLPGVHRRAVGSAGAPHLRHTLEAQCPGALPPRRKQAAAGRGLPGHQQLHRVGLPSAAISAARRRLHPGEQPGLEAEFRAGGQRARQLRVVQEPRPARRAQLLPVDLLRDGDTGRKLGPLPAWAGVSQDQAHRQPAGRLGQGGHGGSGGLGLGWDKGHRDPAGRWLRGARSREVGGREGEEAPGGGCWRLVIVKPWEVRLGAAPWRGESRQGAFGSAWVWDAV
mmetsp:Transcript_28895/g.74885  ORF Transcript_28895/g.74885 Transcript_28895/m.74885 type:complete len:282 (-) Transcript_28895:105-950(-)